MNRFITATAVAVLLGLTPALAGDNAPPTQSNVSPEASKAATQPAEGSADTSGGAMERSSAPPSSGAVQQEGKADQSAHQPAQGSADTSGGAAEQSSAPPGSSAAGTDQPNPTIGADGQKSSDTSKE